MNCYLCENNSHTLIKDKVRDRQDLKVLKCNNCGLVIDKECLHCREIPEIICNKIYISYITKVLILELMCMSIIIRIFT